MRPSAYKLRAMSTLTLYCCFCFLVAARTHFQSGRITELRCSNRISGLVVEYIVAIDVTRVRFPADALWPGNLQRKGLLRELNPGPLAP